jgi:hypothetical protein
MLKTKRRRESYLAWTERTVLNYLYKQYNLWYDFNQGNVLNIKEVNLNIRFTKEMYTDIYTRVGYEFAKETYKDLTGETLKEINFNLITKETISPFQLIINQFIATRLATRITGVNTTSENVIRGLLVQAKKEGLGELETAKLLRSNFQEFSKVRSKTIARTELISSSNYGSLQGAKLTGLNLQKEWIASVGGSNDRLDHTDYNGALVGMDDYFNVGGEDLEYPADVNGSAANTINCACTIGYVRL